MDRSPRPGCANGRLPPVSPGSARPRSLLRAVVAIAVGVYVRRTLLVLNRLRAHVLRTCRLQLRRCGLALRAGGSLLGAGLLTIGVELVAPRGLAQFAGLLTPAVAAIPEQRPGDERDNHYCKHDPYDFHASLLLDGAVLQEFPGRAVLSRSLDLGHPEFLRGAGGLQALRPGDLEQLLVERPAADLGHEDLLRLRCVDHARRDVHV